MTVVLTPAAKADAVEAAPWYRERSAMAADNFLLAVSSGMMRIAANPTA